MDKDSTMRNVIERIVRQEIDRIASETKDVVREAVRTSLLPQLRTAIRDSISEAMEEVLSEAKNLPPAQELGVSQEISPIAPPEPFPSCHSEEALRSPCHSEQSEESRSGQAPRPKNLAQGKLREESLPVEAEFAAKEVQIAVDGDGSYVYCIADSGVAVSLGPIGIEGSEVYTIPYEGLCAVVHKCLAEPYKSDNEEIVKGWVQTHQKVLDTAIEKFDAVLPLGFDIIIKSKDKADPAQIVKDWLEENFESLKDKMDKVRGKQEFGIQIFYDPKVMGEMIAWESEEIQKLEEEMAGQTPGMAYMYKQKVEKVVKEEMEKRAEGYFRDFYEVIKNHAEDVKVEKVRRDKGKTMLMNLSCLISKEKVEDLGNELEKIDNVDGFSVRFTGPWAPYSFV